MRNLTYFVGATLDGFIAGPDDEVDFFDVSEQFGAWLASEWADALPTHVRSQLGLADVPRSRFDTVVMGRRTYQPALDLGITNPYQHVQTWVCSTTLEASEDPIHITNENALEIVSRLKSDAGSELGVLLVGGGGLAGQVAELIDTVVVKKYPVIVGAGISMFERTFEPFHFELKGTRSFDNGCVVLEYERSARQQ